MTRDRVTDISRHTEIKSVAEKRRRRSDRSEREKDVKSKKVTSEKSDKSYPKMTEIGLYACMCAMVERDDLTLRWAAIVVKNAFFCCMVGLSFIEYRP